MRRVGVVLGGVVVLLAVAVAVFDWRHRVAVERAAERFAAERVPPLGDFGTTRKLRILPLVDWHTASPELRGEVGLSYLIETDTQRILFDVGLNEQGSPLLENMAALGVSLDSIDTVFISHNHGDHVGGFGRMAQATFSVGPEQAPLAHPEARAIVPVPMTYPGLEPVLGAEPLVIGPGVASTGTITRQLVGPAIDEQSLAVHVEGLGVVLIVGCGHQPIPNLLRRYDRVFDATLHGVLGGLHLPVPEGRLRMFGIDVQRRLASGSGLFAPITMDEVRALTVELRDRELGVIGVGGHDSSDEVIALFAEVFGEAYRHVRVGEPIVIAAP